MFNVNYFSRFHFVFYLLTVTLDKRFVYWPHILFFLFLVGWKVKRGTRRGRGSYHFGGYFGLGGRGEEPHGYTKYKPLLFTYKRLTEMSKSIVGKKSLLLNKIFLDSEQRVTNLYFIQPQTFIFSAAFDFIPDSSSSPNPSNAQLPLKTEQLKVWELTKNKKLILYINEFLEFTRSIHFSSDILESSIYQRCIQSLI